MENETDKTIKKLWSIFFEQEVSHLQASNYLLQKFEKKNWQEILPTGEYPPLLKLQSNIDYVREVLKNTVNLTGDHEDYIPVDKLNEKDKFFIYQNIVNKPLSAVTSHTFIKDYIEKHGKDYRFEVDIHPIKSLQNREKDNTTVGR